MATAAREELERNWWKRWHAVDFAWEGLSDKPWQGWSVVEATGAMAETLAVEAGTRPATLQDYWRLDASRMCVRSDPEMANELVGAEGQPTFHVAHLPLAYEDGTAAKKVWGDAQKVALDEILSARLGGATDAIFEGDWNERRLVGADRRAQFQGVVLFVVPTAPKRARSPLSVRFELAYFVERAGFDRAPFSVDARFDRARFSDGARFDGATFSGDARFDGTTFSEAAGFDGATFFDMLQMLDISHSLDLAQRANQALDNLRVPDSERKEVEQNLGEATAADLLVRLGGALSEDDKTQLAQMAERMSPGQVPDLEAIAGFFRSKFSQNELIHALAESAQSVFTEFTDAMKRPDGITISAGVGSDSATAYSAAISAGVRFDRATFSGSACFLGSNFSATAQFDRATFFGDTRFENATFSRKCGFGSATFGGPADFSRSHFLGEADFNRTSFADKAFFEYCEFHNETTFERSSFAGVASFAEAQFARATSFEFAQFMHRANFSSAKFLHASSDGSLNFNGVHFANMADFERAKFPISCWQFSAAFNGGRFDGVAYFGDMGLHWIAALHGATLEKTLILDRISQSNADKQFFGTIIPGTRKDVSADVLAKLKKEEEVRYRRASERGQSAEPVTKDERRRWRHELPEQRLKELEGGCRVVKVAMGRQRDEALEQRYYRFQLIARRRQRDTPRVEKVYSWLYGAFADYGLGLWQPVVALFLLTLAFAAIFWGWGEALRGWPDEAWKFSLVHPIEQDFWDALLLSAKRGWPDEAWKFSLVRPIDQDFWDALLLSANNTFRPLSVWSLEFTQSSSSTWVSNFVDAFGMPDQGGQRLAIRLVSTLQSLLSVILLFLFALAVRRRFQIN